MPRNVSMIEVRKICPVCSKECNTPVEADKFYRWRGGDYVQDVWPDQPAYWRERLVSGTHPVCWEWMFGQEEEEL